MQIKSNNPNFDSGPNIGGWSLINTQALSISGGGEYKINNFAINTTIGLSYYTKIEGDSDEKTKLSFTISVLYYLGK